MNIVFAGTEVQSTAAFSNTQTGNPEDPDIVTFAYTLNNGAPVNFIYGVGQAIVRTGVGAYFINLDTTGMAVTRPTIMVGQWASKNVAGPDSVQVVGSATLRINAPAIVPVFS